MENGLRLQDKAIPGKVQEDTTMKLTKNNKQIMMISVIALLIAGISIGIVIYLVRTNSISLDDTEITEDLQDYTFADTGILVEYRSDTSHPDGFCIGDEVILIINNDGTAELEFDPASPHEDGYFPHMTFTIESSVMDELKNQIKAHRFMTLQEDVTNPDVYDGGSRYITVYTETLTHTSGGRNPTAVRFCKMASAIMAVVPVNIETDFYDAINDYYATW
jgi:hypothetical protein